MIHKSLNPSPLFHCHLTGNLSQKNFWVKSFLFFPKIYALFKELSLGVGRHVSSQGHLLPILMSCVWSRTIKERENWFSRVILWHPPVWHCTPIHDHATPCAHTNKPAYTINKTMSIKRALNEHVSSYDKFSPTFHWIHFILSVTLYIDPIFRIFYHSISLLYFS